MFSLATRIDEIRPANKNWLEIHCVFPRTPISSLFYQTIRVNGDISLKKKTIRKEGGSSLKDQIVLRYQVPLVNRPVNASLISDIGEVLYKTQKPVLNFSIFFVSRLVYGTQRYTLNRYSAPTRDRGRKERYLEKSTISTSVVIEYTKSCLGDTRSNRINENILKKKNAKPLVCVTRARSNPIVEHNQIL